MRIIIFIVNESLSFVDPGLDRATREVNLPHKPFIVICTALPQETFGELLLLSSLFVLCSHKRRSAS